MRTLLLVLPVCLLLACSSSSQSDSTETPAPSEPAQVTPRPAFAAFQDRIAAAEDTYDLEDLTDAFERASVQEFRRLVASDWRPNAASLAAIPDEVAIVAADLETKWDELGVVHDGLNHRDSHDRITQMGPRVRRQSVDEFMTLVEQEIEGNAPDTEAMATLVRWCVRACETDERERRDWRASYDQAPEHMLAIVSSPDSIRALKERW